MDDSSREDCCAARFPGRRPPPFEFLGEEGRRLGFAAVGVAPAAPVAPAAVAAYEAWLAAGRHAGMAYAEKHREARIDPRRPEIVAGATAVVSAALPYGDGASSIGLFRHVAAHARGRDYHDTMREKLSALAESIARRFPDARRRVFADTAPVPERTWAVLAGLGDLGANGALFVPGVGPRVVLGEIVCAGTPAPDAAASISLAEPCLGCGACIAACPTGALAAPGVVDCRRCLSFHTIENRTGEIPPDIANRIELVFGCDACTAACPRASGLVPVCRLEPAPHPCPGDVDLSAIAAMDDGDLARRIEGTCLARTGPGALRRNAHLALAALVSSRRP